ncbi:MAG: hypothetical protein IT236_14710 [Bacteroidia bacterium]|nr:hypothetical protein [Bacteroidia bacterium]
MVFLISIVSCKKNKDTNRITVVGKVLNELNNSPVSGITVSLNETCGSSSLGSGSGWGTLESTTTDSNGAYSFDVEVSDCAGWQVDINASPNYSSNYSTSWFQVKPNEKVDKTTFLYRNATLMVTAVTSNSLAPTDSFFMNLPGIGCRCSNVSTTRAKGGFYNEITWTVKRNNVTTSFSDTVFCPVDVIRNYTINY